MVEDDCEDWTGLQVWPGARVLLSFLANHRPDLLAGRRRVVELGCGTGAVGLALAPRFELDAPGATTLVLTDGQPALVEIAGANAELNYGGGGAAISIAARRLLWGDCAEARAQLDAVRRELLAPGDGADLVLAADVIYDAEVVKPLLLTAAQLLLMSSSSSSTPPRAFVLSYCGRCLLADAAFDARIEAAAEEVGLRVVFITRVGEHPGLVAAETADMATQMREANARVFVFEPRGGDADGFGSSAKQEATT